MSLGGMRWLCWFPVRRFERNRDETASAPVESCMGSTLTRRVRRPLGTTATSATRILLDRETGSSLKAHLFVACAGVAASIALSRMPSIDGGGIWFGADVYEGEATYAVCDRLYCA